MGDVAWAQHFDWAYWKVSARTLPVTHPTSAREVATVTMRAKTLHAQTGVAMRTHAAWVMLR